MSTTFDSETGVVGIDPAVLGVVMVVGELREELGRELGRVSTGWIINP